MDKHFRKESGEYVDVIEHCRSVLCANPLTEILIGCDSQNTKKRSEYATVIVFRYGFRGAHFIYQRNSLPKIKDLFTRLFKECEYSLEAAEYIKENSSFKIGAIELDFNDFKKTLSSPLIPATRGWCESLGYKVMLKSGEMYATKAADHVLRHIDLYK